MSCVVSLFRIIAIKNALVIDECSEKPGAECCEGECLFGFFWKTQQIFHHEGVSIGLLRLHASMAVFYIIEW